MPRARPASPSLPVGPPSAAPTTPAVAESPTVRFPEDTAHRDRVRTGQPLPPNWRHAYLEHYALHGTHWKACKFAGVSHRTVDRHRSADPDFATQCEDARQEFADSREVNLARLGDNGNVVGDIVLLKRHRPEHYIEKTMSLQLTAHTELPPEDGRALLAAMFGQTRPPQAPAHADHGDAQTPDRVLDASAAQPATREGAGGQAGSGSAKS